MITALGCGIGREEYNPDKLRYHHIIIMTDADVDGSHIRTLLLTFFYRQMPELIERGHVYIAQPPLYKVKKGKQEQYMKDNDALEASLIQSALDNALLYIGSNNPPISGPGLEKLVLEYQMAMGIIARLSRRYPRSFLNALIYQSPVDETRLGDRDYVLQFATDIEQRLNAQGEASTQYTVEIVEDMEKHIWLPKITVQHHGVFHSSLINKDLFMSSEYRKLIALGKNLNGLLQEGAYIQRGEKQQLVTSFANVVEWIMAEAKKGQSIQRYKGLGEMNPDQLWETTMDPETRRLLQVTIEDVIAADKIFTTLMGDQVEPRREFIEANALEVINLDI